MALRSLEVCAGAGGQMLGLERAGFVPVALIDEDGHTCATLRANRPERRVIQIDLRDFVGAEYPEVLDVDLFSAGLPSGPFSRAGLQRGADDARDLLATAIWLVTEIRPRAILIENVPSLVTDEKFLSHREFVHEELTHLGYEYEWRILDAQDFGVAQRRPHGLLVAMRPEDFVRFSWPEPSGVSPPTVGEVLRDSMKSRGWPGAESWAEAACSIAPTIVGGSKNRGGADLGPSGAKNAWAKLGVNGAGIADHPPGPDFVLEHGIGKYGRDGLPKLTVRQVALLQGFPPDWILRGGKTSQYRQVAQSVPPPVAEAVGRRMATALSTPYL
jgi:DNA (cytosine-5)-methyltransferase 1